MPSKLTEVRLAALLDAELALEAAEEAALDDDAALDAAELDEAAASLVLLPPPQALSRVAPANGNRGMPANIRSARRRARSVS